MDPLLRLVLIVDHPADRDLLLRELRQIFSEVQVTPVASAAELDQALGLPAVDLVITAYELGWSDGLAVLRTLRARQPQWPVILFTDPDHAEAAAAGLAAGLTDYLLRSPTLPVRLRFALRAALEQTRRRPAPPGAEPAAELRLAESTELPPTEAELVNHRDLLRMLIDHLPDPVYLKDREGRYLLSNAAHARLLGVASPEAILGQTCFDLLPPDQAERAAAADNAVFRSGRPQLEQEEHEVDPAGQSHWYLSSRLPLHDPHGQIIGLVGIRHNATEQKQAERQLLQAHLELEKRVQERTAKLTQTNASLQAEINERRRIEAEQTKLSHGLRTVLSLADELIATPTTDLCLRRAVELAREKLGVERCALFLEQAGVWQGTYGTDRHGQTTVEHQIRFIDPQTALPPDTHPHWYTIAGEWYDQGELIGYGWVVYTPIYTAQRQIGFLANDAALSQAPLDPIQQEILAVYCSLLGNILQRKQIEEALAQERDLLHALMDNLPDTIYFKDTASRFTRINRAHARQLGLSQPEAAIGRTDFDFFVPEHAAATYADEQKIITTGEPLIDKIEYTHRTTSRNRWVSTTKVPLRDAQGRITGLVGLSHDITESKQHERDLETIVAISAALRLAHSRAEMLPIILDQTRMLVEAEGAVLILPEADSDDLVIEQGGGVWSAAVGRRFASRPSLSAEVFYTNHPYVNNHALDTPDLLKIEGLTPTRAVAGVGLSTQQQCLGVLWICRQTELQEDEIRLLTTLTNIAANALHRTTLHEQTELQLQQLAALRAIDAAINSIVDLRLTLTILLDQVTAQLRVHAAGVLLLDSHSQFLHYAAGHGFYTLPQSEQPIPLKHSFAGQAILERRLIQVPNLNEISPQRNLPHIAAGEKFVTYLAAPLIAKGQVKGVLEIFHRAPLHPEPAWLDFFETLAGQAALAIDNATLLDELQRSNIDLTLAYDATIEGWSRALDLRDQETEGHTQRVTELTMQLGRAMGLSEAELVHFRRGALLHDIGKMGIPDDILLKPGPLTEAELNIMRRHPVYAYELLSPIAFLRPALEIPYCHHERWDGTGYPRGLKVEQIPLPARIFAVVDVWDALSSNRPYRRGWPVDKIVRHLREQAGKHFDPKIVEVFLHEMGQD